LRFLLHTEKLIMQYLSLENVSRSYGEKVLFKNVHLTISKGDKIALVAKNGSGKSTLLRVISGEEGSDGENAHIRIAKGIRTAMLRQDPAFNPEDTVMEALFNADIPALIAVRNYEEALLEQDEARLQQCMSRLDDLKAWDLESRIKEILSRLLIKDIHQKLGEMSGGQQKRVALAKILIEEPDFIIMDEPTNHLDIEMIEWLESYLQHPGITLFMVTHDRYFLDRICNEIIELDQGNFYVYRGNYSQYLEKREARLLNEASVLEKTKKLYARELEWMRRQPQARTTKAKSRIDDFYEIKDKASQRRMDEEIKMPLATTRLGSKILEAHAVGKKFGNQTMLHAFNYKFKRGERIGIVGPNGAGKSTFLKVLTQQLPVDSGKIVIGETVVFGYYTQEGLQINEDKMVIDVIRDIAEYIPLEKGQKISAESMLERFLFPRPQQRVYVSQLSGGEKRRLYLLTVLMKNPNFLILDEPTNDLDILTLNVLEDYLEDFPGCLIIVTHDRYFMDRLVDHLFVMEGNGVIRDFLGTYSEYRELKKKEALEKTSRSEGTGASEPASNSESKGKVSFEQRKELSKLEKEIKKLEDRKKEITARFEDLTLQPSEMVDLSKELDAIAVQLEEKEDKWLELSESVS
jgi:ATP-binding cassette subfamily F protein uup